MYAACLGLYKSLFFQEMCTSNNIKTTYLYSLTYAYIDYTYMGLG